MADTLTSVLEARAGSDPRTFLRVFGTTTHDRSSAQLRLGATRWAARLRELGVRRGDRVAIAMGPTASTVEAVFGAFMRRAAVLPLASLPALVSTRRPLERLAAMLGAGTPKVLLAGRSTLELVPPDLVAALGVPTHELESPGDATLEPEPDDPGDLALVQYTSGSTGRPRGVMLSHANLLANARASMTALDATPDDRFVSWLPLNHDMGLIGGIFTMLDRGVPTTLIPPEQFLLRPALWLEAITELRATFSAAPNFGYQLCAERVPTAALSRLDLSSWRLALNGAEPIRAETLRAFGERFGPCGFRPESWLPVYGLAESTLAATFARRGRAPRIDRIDPETLRRDGVAAPVADDGRALVSVGTAFPGAAVVVVDAVSGGPLPERHEGEIVLRGPSLMSGYFGDPDATATALRDGWLHTGDLGYLAEGELFVTGRLKAVVIRAGEKHHAEDLEAAAERVPGTRRGCSAVFAVDGPAGEELVIVVERSRQALEPAAALARLVVSELQKGAGLRPDRVLVASPGAVPKTTSGKVERRECHNLLERGELELLARWPEEA